jgi:hypothetical protein
MLPRTVREALSRRIVCSLGAILRAAAEISICLDIGRIFGSAPFLAGFAPCGRGSRFLSPSRLLGRRPRSARGCSAGAGSDLRGRGCLLHSRARICVPAGTRLLPGARLRRPRMLCWGWLCFYVGSWLLAPQPFVCSRFFVIARTGLLPGPRLCLRRGPGRGFRPRLCITSPPYADDFAVSSGGASFEG